MHVTHQPRVGHFISQHRSMAMRACRASPKMIKSCLRPVPAQTSFTINKRKCSSCTSNTAIARTGPRSSVVMHATTEASQADLMYKLQRIALNLESTDQPHMYQLYPRSGGEWKQWCYDPEDVTGRIDQWVDECATKGKPRKPLLIDGLVTVGKSFALNVLVPSCVARHGAFESTDMAVFNFNMHYASSQTWQENKRRLLEDIVSDAEHMGLRSDALDAAWPACVDRSEISETVLLRIFREMPVPTLVLMDDIHKLLFSCEWDYKAGRRTLNTEEVKSACNFVKELICHSSDNVMWAVTGNSMTTLWMDMFGVDILKDATRLTLPSMHDDRGAMAWLLDRLLDQETPKLRTELQPTKKLFLLSENAAMLTELMERSYLSSSCFVDFYNYRRWQVYDQVNKADWYWRLIVREMSEQERSCIFGLATYGQGCKMLDTGSNLMKKHLHVFTEPVQPGSDYRQFQTAHHRDSMLSLFNEDGSLAKDYIYVKDACIMRLDNTSGLLAGPIVAYAGYVLDELLTSKRYKLTSSLLQRAVKDLSPIVGPPSTWHSQPWFQKVWFHVNNQAEGYIGLVTCIRQINGGTAGRYKRVLRQHHRLMYRKRHSKRGRRSGRGVPEEHHLAYFLMMLGNVWAKDAAHPENDVDAIIRSCPVLQLPADLHDHYYCVLNYSSNYPKSWQLIKEDANAVRKTNSTPQWRLPSRLKTLDGYYRSDLHLS